MDKPLVKIMNLQSTQLIALTVIGMKMMNIFITHMGFGHLRKDWKGWGTQDWGTRDLIGKRMLK